MCMCRALVLRWLGKCRLELVPAWNEKIETSTRTGRTDWNRYQRGMKRLKPVPAQEEQIGTGTGME